MNSLKPHLSKFLLAISALTGIVSVAGFAGRHHWAFDNLSHFRVQYFAILSLVAVYFINAKAFRAAVFSLLLGLVNAVEIYPAYIAAGNPAAGKSPVFRVVTINLYSYNRNSEKITAFIQKAKPDFIFFEEFNKRLRNELQQTLHSFSYSQITERDDGSGIGFMSQIKYQKAEVLFFKEKNSPFVSVKFKDTPGNLTLIGVHLDTPRSSRSFKFRNEQLSQLAGLIDSLPESEHIMLLGDLNTTPWSPHFKALLTKTGLRNGRNGWGILPSWPTYFFPFGIPIDHCLTSSGITLSNLETGPDIGSDHFPLIIDFALTAKPSR